MKKELVTIITPCYNGENYVENLLKSIINQTYKKIEFIFVNDGSKDKTEQIIKKYEPEFKDKNITLKYIKQRNGGQAKAVNTGLKEMEGEYLIWADSDDYFEDDAIENMVNFLENNPEYSAVRGEVAFRKFGDKENIERIGKSQNPENDDLFVNYIVQEDVYCFIGVMMVKSEKFLKTNKGRKIYINRAGQNWQLILPSVYKGKTGYINKVTYNYLIRENSHSHQKENAIKFLQKIENHKKILTHTINKIVDDNTEKEKYKKMIEEKYTTQQKDFLKYKFRHFSKEHIKYKFRNWNLNYVRCKIKEWNKK